MEDKEGGPEQLPLPHLATQGPRPTGIWLAWRLAHIQDPPCHPSWHSLVLAEPLVLMSAYFALSFKKLHLPLLTSHLPSGTLGPLRPPLT